MLIIIHVRENWSLYYMRGGGGGRKEGCRARYSQKWLIGVKGSALETRFVLAEGTHQSRCLFGEFRRRKFTTSVQPAKAYKDESVIMSRPHSQWPVLHERMQSTTMDPFACLCDTA